MQTGATTSTSNRRYSSLFVVVTAVFITCLITANITAVKLIEVFGFVLPAAVIIFPISYIFGDVLTEVYGYRQARRVIWIASFLAYLVGEFANSFVLARLKIATRGR